MYNFNECWKNYRKTTGSVQNYYEDKPADPITNSESFEYKSNVTEKSQNNGSDDNNTKDVNIVVPLKYLSKFWRALDIPLINCKVNLILAWFKNCVLTDMTIHDSVNAKADNPARLAINAPTSGSSYITDTILYVTVITLSIEDGNKLLQQLKQDQME